METQSEPSKVFKVLFRGVILPGFDKDDVIKNVHDITRIPEAIIKRKFFSGKTVVIRHADTQEYATRLQKTFAQAGIETYIEEIVKENLSANEDFNEYNASESPEHSDSASKGSKTLILVSIVVITLIAMVFLTDVFTGKESEIPVSMTDTQKTQPEEKIAAKPVKNKSTDSETPLQSHPVSPSQRKSEPAVLFSYDDITQLIKITRLNELKRIKTFLPLFRLTEKQQAGIKKLLKEPLIISEQEPLYLFRTRNNFGLYVKFSSSAKDLSDIQSLLAENTRCAVLQALSLKQHNNHYLLSSFNIDKKNTDTEDFYLSLKHTLHNSQVLFSSEQSPADAIFYFYMKSLGLPVLKLIASREEFIFLTDADFKSKTIEEKTGIHLNTLQSLDSSVPDLWNQVLFTISQNKPATFPKKHLFTEQLSSTFNTGSQLKPYQKQLDVEFQPQWSSGPFAINTAAFSFEKNHPVIEILAKGQNINTFIEYSAMAQLYTDKVLNRFQQNTMVEGCTSADSVTDNPVQLFKNTDGEQEAYINEDFVSFQTISARDKLLLTSDTQLSDIIEIQGKIALIHPEKILEKNLNLNKPSGILLLEDFILVYDSTENNTLNYQVIGNTAQFISLRAYNNNGEIIATTDFQYQSQFNQSIKQFKRVFAKPLNNGQVKLKVFYSPQYQVKQYPFKFKPEIKPGQSLSQPLPDDLPVAPEQDQLEIAPLNEQISSDNPQWLGDRLASTTVAPFYINLYQQQNDSQTVADAIVNIKLSLTPLIHHNLSSTRLILQQSGSRAENGTLYNNFIHFNHKIMEDIQQDYLDSNTAIQINTQAENIKGEIDLYLPREFMVKSADFKAPGQTIKTNSLQITLIKQTSRSLEFAVSGNLKTLVQLKIYNKNRALISDLIEYRQVDDSHARLDLMYYGEPDSIKLISGKNILTNQYQFEL